jgi:hypothetical protein
MGKNSRGRSKGKWLLVLTGIVIFSFFTGCGGGEMTSSGGGRISLEFDCNGLSQFGYSKPYSEQDVKDIAALGLERCLTPIKRYE